MPAWSDEAIATLCRLWGDESLSAAEIGRRMRLGKNAVVGKAHRLGLPGRASPAMARARIVGDAPLLVEVA